MTLYKVADANDQSGDGIEWGENVTHAATGTGKELFTDGWIHAHEHPLLAALLIPAIYVDPRNILLWEAEGEIGLRDGQLKCGCRSLTTIRRIEMPEVAASARVRFAVMCAMAVDRDPSFVGWAYGWLNGTDRSHEKAVAAGMAASVRAVQHRSKEARGAAKAAWCATCAACAACQQIEITVMRRVAEAAYVAVRAAALPDSVDLLVLAQRAIAEESTMPVQRLGS
jgi:hypothetical protein